MNLKELSFPVRVYWDLTPFPVKSEPDYTAITEDIIVNRVLSLGLSDLGNSVSNVCISILKRLEGQKINVSLTISAPALDNQAIALLSDMNLKALFIDCSSFNEVRSAVEKPGQIEDGGAGKLRGISFNLSGENYSNIPDILSYCFNNGIRAVVFPIQRLIKGGKCFYLNEGERDKLAGRLNRLNFKKMNITIHDPFLWRVFFPSEQFHEGGCQAANSMIYISPEGDVYPCPALPVQLGNLMETGLKEIMLSSAKKEFRDRLKRPPSQCVECDEVNTCLGGCRGRAYVFHGSLSSPDPAC